VRAWSVRRNMESWALEMGTIEGATNEQPVWDALEEFKRRRFGALTIKRCFIDQKYRTQYVMAFCHEHRRWAFPVAGRMPKTADAAAQAPLRTSNVEVRKDGKVIKGGVALKRWTVNTDFFKRWVHDRISRGEGGGYHIPIDATDDYCQQLVAEARVVKPGGRIEWVLTQKQNHFLDCEQMQVACAYSLRLQHYAQPLKGAQPDEPQEPPPNPPAPSPQRSSGWMSRSRGGGRWMR
jgi:phage terminase large subunit GpA-like protein